MAVFGIGYINPTSVGVVYLFHSLASFHRIKKMVFVCSTFYAIVSVIVLTRLNLAILYSSLLSWEHF